MSRLDPHCTSKRLIIIWISTMTVEVSLSDSFTLPCGLLIKNRFVKAALSEQLADNAHQPTQALSALARRWAWGEVGIILTGNVMVDRLAIGEPFNVVLDKQSELGPFAQWAKAGRENGAQHFIQLNHPGKQIPILLSKQPVAPSALPLGIPGFGRPRALSCDEIWSIIERFAFASAQAQEAGFSGVQIHGAHGYLVSQFLSPHHNRREDEWGGSPENRRRFLLEIYRAIRSRVGATFAIAVKLNSADFQKGGFGEQESLEVVDVLTREGVDLLEVSGGNYEKPAMIGAKVAESTHRREAYFLEFAEKVRQQSQIPLVVTGGFRSGTAMREALATRATDFIGMGRPLAVNPDFCRELLSDPMARMDLPRPTTGVKALDKLALLDLTYYENFLQRHARGLPVTKSLSPWFSVWSTFRRMGLRALMPRRA